MADPCVSQLANTVLAAVPQDSEPSRAATDLVSPSLGERYVVLKLHDQGGMGRIWVARDTNLDREVAVKELLPELTESPTALARFLREARVTGQLEHPGIVPVYELAQTSQQYPFYAMRFVRGRTFSQASLEFHERLNAAKEAPLDLSVLLHAFVMVCNTISYAHSRGVIHRDLKGPNVLLGDFGEVLVLDWGLAKVVNLPEILADHLSALAEKQSEQMGLTLHGSALGSPSSMSPEQASGQLDQVDHRTDIYGLGSILYEILTGQPPFSGTTVHEVLGKVRLKEPVPPRRYWPAVPLGLEAICLRALAKDPSARHATAKELAEAVQQWQEAERRQAEQALRASEEQYRSLADLIPGIVWTARADGWIDYANQFWYEFTGLTPEQTMGSGWASVVHADDWERVANLWTKSLQTGEPIEVDYRIRRTDGVYRWFLAQARPVRDKDRQIFKWFGMLTEIEDQRTRSRL